MNYGLKLGSREISYTEQIFSLYHEGYFQYIELFAVPGSFHETIGYWKQFSFPFVIHAPHSFAGMNIALFEERENNKNKIQETIKFADALNAEYIIFHSGVNGDTEETISQLQPFADSRFLIENKPLKGLNGEKCLGATFKELKYIIKKLQVGFCLDFGHAICTANSIKRKPIKFINKLFTLNPKMFHLTDGDYFSEYDTHYHYGKGNYPIRELFNMVPVNSKITNEARHEGNLLMFKEDSLYFMSILYIRKAEYSDMDILFEWANDPLTRLNSLNQDTIPYQSHKEWFKRKISSNTSIIFIYHLEQENIGQVRLDINDSTANINYSISPLHRGKGYGNKILQLIENKIKHEYTDIKTLTAVVKNENIASLKIFRKLKYNEITENNLINFSKFLQNP